MGEVSISFEDGERELQVKACKWHLETGDDPSQQPARTQGYSKQRNRDLSVIIKLLKTEF